MKIKANVANSREASVASQNAVQSQKESKKELTSGVTDTVGIETGKAISGIIDDKERVAKVQRLKELYSKGELKPVASDKLSKAIGNFIEEELAFENVANN